MNGFLIVLWFFCLFVFVCLFVFLNKNRVTYEERKVESGYVNYSSIVQTASLCTIGVFPPSVFKVRIF